jgi:hypothetical protein
MAVQVLNTVRFASPHCIVTKEVKGISLHALRQKGDIPSLPWG